MSEFPIIETPRLSLRLLEAGEEKIGISYYKNNLEHLKATGPVFPEDFFSEPFWTKQIEKNRHEFKHDQSLRMFLFEKGGADSSRDHGNFRQAAGHVSFAGILRGAAQFCYLGYGLAQNKVGQGYMSEILPAAISYAFNEMSLHRIMANYLPTNERSARLLKKLGFNIEGYARDYLLLNGSWQDHILSSLINHRWNT